MNALYRKNFMFKWLKKTALWIVAVPLLTIYLGAASNQLVLAVNGDTFPVHVNAVKINQFAQESGIVLLGNGTIMLDDTHCVMTKHTHLNVLADWIDLKDAIYSPGDGLIYLGEWASGFSLPVWMAVVLGKLNRQEE
jgi:hypothetical protein